MRREDDHARTASGRRRRGAQDIADYVLTYRNHKLAVIEAKGEDGPEPKAWARRRNTPRSCRRASPIRPTARGIYQIDMETGAEQYVERYPDARKSSGTSSSTTNAWRDRFAAVPFEDKGGTWQARYYQHNAIENALEAIANGQKRILLTLATGTGKTFIAFQIAWKLFQSRWNLSGEPTRRPRILFLADRNILADRPTTPSRPFPRMRWCGSRPTKSASKAACRKTAASSSRSSRPS